MWVWELVQFVVLKRVQAVAGLENRSAKGKGKPRIWAAIVSKVAHSNVVKRHKNKQNIMSL